MNSLDDGDDPTLQATSKLVDEAHKRGIGIFVLAIHKNLRTSTDTNVPIDELGHILRLHAEATDVYARELGTPPKPARPTGTDEQLRFVLASLRHWRSRQIPATTDDAYRFAAFDSIMSFLDEPEPR